MKSNFVKYFLLTSLLVFFSLKLSCTTSEEVGLEVVEVKKPGIPVIHFKVVIKSGSMDDPEGKEGLAYFVANLLRRGTKSFSRDEIEEMLDFISAKLNIRTEKEVIVISGTTLKENLDKFYHIFCEVILDPTFPEEEIEKMRVDQINAIENIKQDDTELAACVFENFLFRGHPYGHLVEGKISSVKSFTRQDAIDFYDKHFLRNNIILGIAGDFDERIRDAFRTDLSGLEKGELSSDETTLPQLVGKKVILIEKEGRAQTHLRIGHPLTITRKDSDFIPLYLSNTYLGRHRESLGRLFQTVRSDRGLSYGAYSYVEHFQQAGWSKLTMPNIPRRVQYFSMWTYPKSTNAKFVIKLALKELSDLVNHGINEEAFNFIRNFEKNHLPFDLETPERNLGLLMDEEFYRNFGFWENFEKRVEEVSSEEVREVVKRYLSADNFAIVALVSDGEEFKRELLSDKTRIEYPSGVDPNALKGADEKIKTFNLNLKPENFEIVKVEELFR
ncbi:MAG: insulinase family protein [candidate division Zixibacteria bacterium]|nr:insulinase family protein [candidate division Zixibacteria bacterium]